MEHHKKDDKPGQIPHSIRISTAITAAIAGVATPIWQTGAAYGRKMPSDTDIDPYLAGRGLRKTTKNIRRLVDSAFRLQLKS